MQYKCLMATINTSPNIARHITWFISIEHWKRYRMVTMLQSTFWFFVWKLYFESILPEFVPKDHIYNKPLIFRIMDCGRKGNCQIPAIYASFVTSHASHIQIHWYAVIISHPPHHGHTKITIMGMNDRLTSLSFHVNQPSNSWDKAISNSDLEKSRPRSWMWSIGMMT